MASMFGGVLISWLINFFSYPNMNTPYVNEKQLSVELWSYNHEKENNCKLYDSYKRVVMTPTRHNTRANAGIVHYIMTNQKRNAA